MIIHPAADLPLLDAVRTISRSAHAWRDRAASNYDHSRYKAASTAKLKKETCYSLKERGIIHAHRKGLVRYIGRSPQGMAVYQYGDDQRQCFHSCLHPAGVEHPLIEDHPEVLLVPSRRLQHRICDAVHTLDSLPVPSDEYERSAPPRIARRVITCYECGEEGHIARHCPERYEYFTLNIFEQRSTL